MFNDKPRFILTTVVLDQGSAPHVNVRVHEGNVFRTEVAQVLAAAVAELLKAPFERLLTVEEVQTKQAIAAQPLPLAVSGNEPDGTAEGN